MPTFLVEPFKGRIAISVPAKSACATLRMWLWELGSGLPYTGADIFESFKAHTYDFGRPLPESVEVAVAVHRDGVERLRSAYDHRIRLLAEAPDMGIDHFAKHLPEYCMLYPIVGHHCRPQSFFLGSDTSTFTDIIPVNRLDLLADLVRSNFGDEPPAFLRVHETENRSAISEETAFWFSQWISHDQALGWDGVTLRLFESGEASELRDQTAGQPLKERIS